nr:MAG TPA: hypothetical protein [Caudoviricetes sp.]
MAIVLSSVIPCVTIPPILANKIVITNSFLAIAFMVECE